MLQPKPKKKIVKKKTNNPYEGQKDAFGNPVSGEGTRPPFTRKERSKMPRVGSMGSGKNGKTIKKAKSGKTIKKAQDGNNTVRGLRLMGENSRKVSPNKSKYISEDGNYKMKFKGGSDTSAPTSAVQRRTLKGFLKGAPKAAGKMTLKSGGSMKKCKYGCK